MGITIKLNDRALLDSVTAKVEQAKALLRPRSPIRRYPQLILLQMNPVY